MAIGGATFVADHTVPLVYLEQISVAFVGYPSVNSGVSLSTVYQVECQSGVYQHAAPLVTAQLTDQSTQTVTSSCAIDSADTAVVATSGTTRLMALSPGKAVISARFGSTTSSSTLTVAAEVL